VHVFVSLLAHTLVRVRGGVHILQQVLSGNMCYILLVLFTFSYSKLHI
jgi:hypothetical protein